MQFTCNCKERCYYHHLQTKTMVTRCHKVVRKAKRHSQSTRDLTPWDIKAWTRSFFEAEQRMLSNLDASETGSSLFRCKTAKHKGTVVFGFFWSHLPQWANGSSTRTMQTPGRWGRGPPAKDKTNGAKSKSGVLKCRCLSSTCDHLNIWLSAFRGNNWLLWRDSSGGTPLEGLLLRVP